MSDDKEEGNTHPSGCVEDKIADSMFRIGTALNEKAAKLFKDEKVSTDDAVSMCFGWGIGAAMNHFDWSPEEIGKRAEALARDIGQNAKAILGEERLERLHQIKHPRETRH